jgi:hypothetical protein
MSVGGQSTGSAAFKGDTAQRNRAAAKEWRHMARSSGCCVVNAQSAHDTA